MNCRSCKENVPPKFAHSISTNVCPLCGQEIMDPKLQNIFGELKIVLEDAKDYMVEVEDWLFSNFSLKKIAENEVVVDKNMIRQPGKSSPLMRSDHENSDNVEIEERPMTEFAKRAGIHKVKKAIDYIKGSSGAADISEFQGVDEYGESFNPEDSGPPLHGNEHLQMENLFPNDVPSQVELEKLKKMKSQYSFNNGAGKFRRD